MNRNWPGRQRGTSVLDPGTNRCHGTAFIDQSGCWAPDMCSPSERCGWGKMSHWLVRKTLLSNSPTDSVMSHWPDHVTRLLQAMRKDRNVTLPVVSRESSAGAGPTAGLTELRLCWPRRKQGWEVGRQTARRLHTEVQGEMRTVQ